jgi:hypothetical protein
MSQPIKPVAKVVYICDDVVRDSASGKVSVLNLWDTIRFSSDDTFPFRLKKLCVFVWWRDGLGTVTTRVDVVHASTRQIVHQTNNCMIRFPSRGRSVFGRYMIQDCEFPEPGKYCVEMFCENEFVDDQVIQFLPK